MCCNVQNEWLRCSFVNWRSTNPRSEICALNMIGDYSMLLSNYDGYECLYYKLHRFSCIWPDMDFLINRRRRSQFVCVWVWVYICPSVHNLLCDHIEPKPLWKLPFRVFSVFVSVYKEVILTRLFGLLRSIHAGECLRSDFTADLTVLFIPQSRYHVLRFPNTR